MVVIAVGLTMAGSAMLLTRRGRGRSPRRSSTADFWDWVDMELERARRYGHAVALLRLDGVEGAANHTSEPQAGAPRVRAIDHAWAAGTGLYVLAPETDHEGAAVLLERLRHEHGAAGAARVACFPADAVTRHGLLELLEDDRSAVRLRPAFRRAS